MNKLKSHIKWLPLLLAVVLVFSLFSMAGPDAILASGGVWTQKDDSEIYWVKTASSTIENEELKAQVQLFAKELKEKCELDLPISYGDISKAGANDIVLNLDSSANIAEQGYTIAASSTNVVISAKDDDGLFYGCRDLIKQRMLNGNVSSKTEQAPDVLERGLSLDNGRKYFSAGWIKELIREMSWSNMNCLTLHFSEEMGLGIESKLYTWLNGRDGRLSTQGVVSTDNRQLSQEEVLDIISYAKLYHVDVIPSLDTPGHMNYIVMKFNEQCATQDYTFTYNGKDYTAKAGSEIGNYLHYNGTTSIVQGSDATKTNSFATSHSRGIDISNEVAVAFTRSLVEEYARLFKSAGCTKIDIGGDELLGFGENIQSGLSKWKQLDHWKTYAQNRTGDSNAVAYDAFLLYMNDMNDLVRSLGYTSVRMWNDDVLRTDTGWSQVVQLDTSIDVWYWITGRTATQYISAGYEVYNILGDYNYLAMKSDPSVLYNAKATAETIYNEWTPYTFTSTSTSSEFCMTSNRDKVLGTALGVWCDYPDSFTEASTSAMLYPMIRSHGAKAWDYQANSSVNYTTFTANWTTWGAAPTGTQTIDEIYIVADRTALQAAVDDYANTDLTYYSKTSADAYTAAVAAGQAVLAQAKPSQADVDAAAAAIVNAKAALTKPDATGLQAAIQLYKDEETTLSTDYTPETVAVYRNAVEAAETLLSGQYTEAQVSEALAAIELSRSSLRRKGESGGEIYFLSGAFKADTVYVGKVATIQISIVDGMDVSTFDVYDDNGQLVAYEKVPVTDYKGDRDNYCLRFTATAAMVGNRTFYVYAVDSNSQQSPDYLELTVTIKE